VIGQNSAMREFCWLLLAAAPAVARADLPPDIERVLTAHKIPPSEVSVLVQEVDADKPVVSHLIQEARSPASVMKTITTWSALELLGPAFVWQTEVYELGTFDGRKLDGSLALKGYGDPYLVEEELWKLVHALRRSGLEEIGGDLVLDDSYFDVTGEPDPGSFDGQPYRTYNVVPSALMMNFKAVTFQFLVDPERNRVRVVTDPTLDNLTIRNRLDLVDGACGGYNNGIEFSHANPDTLAEVVLDGKFSRRCDGYTMSRTAK
jgi:D-alanyl-D-alanine carboxypeptidase/D-alanyl-D-alanine-endopeptidase (penicillin-binding protein 4)